MGHAPPDLPGQYQIQRFPPGVVVHTWTEGSNPAAPGASHKNAITAADLDWTAQRSKLYNELKGWKCLLPSNGYAATLIFWAGKARLFCGTFEVALRGIVLLDRPAFMVAVTQLANTKAADGGPWQARATTHRHTLGYGLVFMPA